MDGRFDSFLVVALVLSETYYVYLRGETLPYAHFYAGDLYWLRWVHTVVVPGGGTLHFNPI